MFRLWPHKLLGEGHFVAVLRKAGGEEGDVSLAPAEKLPKQWQELARELEISLPVGKAISFGQTLFWAPLDLPQLRGLKVLRPGLELGVDKKGRFEPAHALALWLSDCRNNVSLDPEGRDLEAYLHGDVIAGTQKSWCLVKAGKYSIGWAKGDGNWLKNHYPKGLRR
jgi:NOL1/NOP2/fmu family ribosome biogenesis protein